MRPTSLNQPSFPTSTSLPSILPRMPRPVRDSKFAAALSFRPRSRAAATIAAPSGCSLPCSRLATSRISSSSCCPATGITVTSFGLPSVSVPVLSITSVSTFSMISSASAFFTKTPACAPRPVPTIIAIGVANPRAHGQAIIRTATAFTNAFARRGSGPRKAQAMNVTDLSPYIEDALEDLDPKIVDGLLKAASAER